MPHGIDCLPRNEHGHDRGLACPGGQLQRQAQQAKIGIIAGLFQVFEKALAIFAKLRGDLGQPDGGLGSFDLAEKRAHISKLVVAPMFQQAGCFGGDAPLRLGQLAPGIHFLPDSIDDGGVVISLLGRAQALAFIKQQLRLLVFTFVFARPGNRRDEVSTAAAGDDFLGRLTAGVQLPMPGRILIRRIQNGLGEKLVTHFFVP